MCLIRYWEDDNDNELQTNAVLHWGRQAFPFCLSIKGMYSGCFWDCKAKTQFTAVKFWGNGNTHRWRSVMCLFLAGEVLICIGPFCMFTMYLVRASTISVSTCCSGTAWDVFWYTLWCHFNEAWLTVCLGPVLECHWLFWNTIYCCYFLHTRSLIYQYQYAVCNRSFWKQLYNRLQTWCRSLPIHVNAILNLAWGNSV